MADALELSLALSLFFQQLTLAGDIASVAFGGHMLSYRAHLR